MYMMDAGDGGTNSSLPIYISYHITEFFYPGEMVSILYSALFPRPYPAGSA